MSEKKFRHKIIQMLKPLRAFPVENPMHDGTPDVHCLAGWIELKVANSPTRHTTRVAIGLRPAQKIWMRGWRLQNGRVWTLLLIDERHVLLHDGHWSAQNFDLVDYPTLSANALYGWLDQPLRADSLIEQLLKPLPRITCENG